MFAGSKGLYLDISISPNRFWLHPAPAHCRRSATVPHSAPDQLPDMTSCLLPSCCLSGPRSSAMLGTCAVSNITRPFRSVAATGDSLVGYVEHYRLLPCGVFFSLHNIKQGNELGGHHHTPRRFHRESDSWPALS